MWSGDRSIQIPFGQCKDVDLDRGITTVEVDQSALSELVDGEHEPGSFTGEVIVHTDLFYPPPIERYGAYLNPKMLDPHVTGLAKLRNGDTIAVQLRRLVQPEPHESSGDE